MIPRARQALLAATIGFAALAAGGGAWSLLHARQAAPTSNASTSVAWKEIAWPFLRDGWPRGRAFACVGSGCEGGITLVARVKSGFCDCSRGVADDDEIDRVGDMDLVSSKYSPVGAGEVRSLAGMTGRERLYRIEEPAGEHVLSLAGGRNCNAFVAMAITKGDLSPRAADMAAAFINEPTLSRWIATQQDGG